MPPTAKFILQLTLDDCYKRCDKTQPHANSVAAKTVLAFVHSINGRRSYFHLVRLPLATRSTTKCPETHSGNEFHPSQR